MHNGLFVCLFVCLSVAAWMSFPPAVIVTAVIALGFAAQWLAWRIKLPAIFSQSGV